MKELTDKSFSYRYYFQLSMLLMIIMVSCEQKEDTTKEKEVLKIDVREIDSTAVEKLDRKELYQSILSDSIIKSLDNYAITELPFSNREDFLKTQGVESIGVKDSVDIWSQKEQLGVLDHFLTLEMIEKSCNIDFELDDKDFSNVYLLLIKRFKPVNDSIELLLFSNKYDEFSNEGNESDVMFWVIASINTHKKGS